MEGFLLVISKNQNQRQANPFGPNGFGLRFVLEDNCVTENYQFGHTRLIIWARQKFSDLCVKFNDATLLFVNGNVSALSDQNEATITLAEDKSIPCGVLHHDLQQAAASSVELTGSFQLIALEASTGNVQLINDRSASRPIYIYSDHKQIAFSSDIRAILSLPEIQSGIDEEKLVEFIRLQLIFGQKTIYRNIETLAPASIIRLTASHFSFETVNYWSLKPGTQFEDEHQAALHLVDVFRNAANRITRGTRHGGLLLSGGLDSRLILSLIAEIGIDLRTFTFGFDLTDEGVVAENVAKIAGVPWELVIQSEHDYWENIDTGLSAIQGQYSIAHSHSLLTALKMDQQGVDTIYNGWGLDLPFSGSYLPKEYQTLGGKPIYTYRLAPIKYLDEIPALLLDTLDIQNRDFYRTFLNKGLFDLWDSSPLKSIYCVVDRISKSWQDPYDIYEKAIVVSGWPRFRSFIISSAIRLFAKERNLLMDSEVIDAYLRLPTKYRFLGPVYRQSMLMINRQIATVKYSNIGTSPYAHPYWQAFSLQKNRFLIGKRAQLRSYLSKVGLGHLLPPKRYGGYPEVPELIAALFSKKTIKEKNILDVLLDGKMASAGLLDRAHLEHVVSNSSQLSNSEALSLSAVITMAYWLEHYSP